MSWLLGKAIPSVPKAPSSNGGLELLVIEGLNGLKDLARPVWLTVWTVWLTVWEKIGAGLSMVSTEVPQKTDYSCSELILGADNDVEISDLCNKALCL